MQHRMMELETQRRAMVELLEKSVVKIQKVARGFITRLKIKNVQRWKEDFERARLHEMLGSMQATVKGFEETLHRKLEQDQANSSEDPKREPTP